MDRRVAAIAGVALVGCVNLFWGLGSSSYFGDEVFSLLAADRPFGEILDRVRQTEVASPLYYWLLHGWIELTGSISEVPARLPSAIAGLGLVGVCGWLGWLVAGRRAALFAALLAAVSPLTLIYAHQVRAYIFAALMATIAVAALLQAQRGTCRRWLIVSATAAVLAIWFHYTAVLVIAPLALWVLVRSPFRLRSRIAYGTACVGSVLIVLPLLLEQAELHPPTLIYAELRLSTALRVFAAPFDTVFGLGRIAPHLLGAAILIAAACAWLVWGRTGRVRHGWVLLPAAALVTPIGLLLVGAFGAHTLTSRYAAVALGPMVVLIAAAAVVSPRRVRTVLLTVALTFAAIGSIAQHRPRAFYPDTRAAVAHIAERWQPGDLLITEAAGWAISVSSDHYAEIALPPGTEVAHFKTPEFSKALKERQRFWLISRHIPEDEYARRLARVAYVPAEFAYFGGTSVVQVTLAASSRSSNDRAVKD